MANPNDERVNNLSLTSFITPLLLLLVWQALDATHVIDHRFFPSPIHILTDLIHLIRDGRLEHDLFLTLTRMLLGYLLGALTGAILGLVLGLSLLLRRALYPLLAALYPIPVIAIFPLVMLVFGLGNLSKIITVAVSVFFLVLFNTMTGVLTIPRIYKEVGRSFQINRIRFIWKIALPGALPNLFTGLRLGIGVALIVIIAVEFVAANHGLGHLIWQSWQTFAVGKMFAGLLVTALLGFLFTTLVDWLEKKLVPWHI